MNEKIAKIKKWMEHQDVGSLVVTDPAHQFYLSGFKALIYSRPIILIIDQEKTALILPGLEENHAKSEAMVDHIYTYHEYPERQESDAKAAFGMRGQSPCHTGGRFPRAAGELPHPHVFNP